MSNTKKDDGESIRGWMLIIFVVFTVVSLLVAGLRDQRAYNDRIISAEQLHRLIRDCYAVEGHTEIVRDARMNVVDFNCIAYKVE